MASWRGRQKQSLSASTSRRRTRDGLVSLSLSRRPSLYSHACACAPREHVVARAQTERSLAGSRRREACASSRRPQSESLPARRRTSSMRTMTVIRCSWLSFERERREREFVGRVDARPPRPTTVSSAQVDLGLDRLALSLQPLAPSRCTALTTAPSHSNPTQLGSTRPPASCRRLLPTSARSSSTRATPASSAHSKHHTHHSPQHYSHSACRPRSSSSPRSGSSSWEPAPPAWLAPSSCRTTPTGST